MDNLHARIRAAQITAGEEVVMQSLRERGLLDGQTQDPRDAEIERLQAVLRQIKNTVCGDRAPCWSDADATTATRYIIADLCNFVLRTT